MFSFERFAVDHQYSVCYSKNIRKIFFFYKFTCRNFSQNETAFGHSRHNDNNKCRRSLNLLQLSLLYACESSLLACAVFCCCFELMLNGRFLVFCRHNRFTIAIKVDRNAKF